jgi:transposase
MRGFDEHSGSLFSYVDLETRVPKDHPLRAIRAIANSALSELSSDFAALYAPLGRPSIPPEKLLRASLLQAFYSISERQLMERLEFDLLFRWFVGLGIDDPAWDHSVFSTSRARSPATQRRNHRFRVARSVRFASANHSPAGCCVLVVRWFSTPRVAHMHKV